MKIALFGASGIIGQRIAQEALDRGHEVTAISRNPQKMPFNHLNLHMKKGDAADADSVAQAVMGQDVVISAIGPSSDNVNSLVTYARSLIDGIGRAGVRRFLIVGGAGSLEVAPGKQLVDTPEFPAGWRPLALAHRDAYDIYRTARNLDWTYFSPAAFIEPGQRTGKYRIGTDKLVTNAHGESRISAEDYAIAMLDEVEKPQFIRQRFTVAY